MYGVHIHIHMMIIDYRFFWGFPHCGKFSILKLLEPEEPNAFKTQRKGHQGLHGAAVSNTFYKCFKRTTTISDYYSIIYRYNDYYYYYLRVNWHKLT